jgi:hypothetical protein
MSGVTEAASQTGGQFQSELLAGLSRLSDDQEIVFAQYIRYVHPLDGYVSWLRTKESKVRGSLHYDARAQQNVDESFSVNRIVFTTTTQIEFFDRIAPNTLWVGEHAGMNFAFSHQAPFYEPSGLFHYRGDAVYPVMQTQLVDVGAQSNDLIVSNSLPAWLTLQSYAPIWLTTGNPGITLYPAHLVPDNIRPPFGAVDIPAEETQPFAGLPIIGQQSQHSQLAREFVDVTLYGLTNAQALSFLDLVNQFALDTEAFGIMSATVARDPKRIQTELGVIAMKKTFRFEVNYLQESILDVALQLIKSAPITYILGQEP